MTAINKWVRKEDWFMWVSMTKGTISLPIFQSLEAFWPGILVGLEKALKGPDNWMTEIPPITTFITELPVTLD